MGLYDIINFSKPIACKRCGILHKDTETKQFDNIMASYSIGDIIPRNIISGVLKETIFCDHGNEEDREKFSFDQSVYLVIWHRILIDITENPEEAENILTKFGLGDLYFLYEKIYSEKINYETKYNKLKSYIKAYVEYLTSTKEEQEKFIKGEKIFIPISAMHIKKYLNKENPFEELIKDLDEERFTEKTMF